MAVDDESLTGADARSRSCSPMAVRVFFKKTKQRERERDNKG